LPPLHAHALRQHEQADHPAVALERDEHALAQAARRPPLAQVGLVDPVQRQHAALALGELAQPVHDRLVERLEHLLAVARPERGPQRGPELGREQHQLGDLDPEGAARALEQHLELGDDLRRARQRRGCLVQELELRVPPALGHVGPVGEDQHPRREQQEERGGRADRVYRRRRQRQATIDGRDPPVDAEHVDPLAQA
jgi:hypothetical protein